MTDRFAHMIWDPDEKPEPPKPESTSDKYTVEALFQLRASASAAADPMQRMQAKLEEMNKAIQKLTMTVPVRDFTPKPPEASLLRGFNADLVVFDEAYTLPDAVLPGMPPVPQPSTELPFWAYNPGDPRRMNR